MRRWRAWRNRLRSEVCVFGTYRFRVTWQRGKIVGIEQWCETGREAYGYLVWKTEIRR